MSPKSYKCKVVQSMGSLVAFVNECMTKLGKENENFDPIPWIDAWADNPENHKDRNTLIKFAIEMGFKLYLGLDCRGEK